jgi:acetyltransferase-like isoleucine patch superfamily enzyme
MLIFPDEYEDGVPPISTDTSVNSLLPILVNEKISLSDLIWKYTIRDFILGICCLVPSSIGIVLRMAAYKLAFKKCGRGLAMRSHVSILFPERMVVGEHVGIDEFSFIEARGGLKIGDYVRIAPHAVIVTSKKTWSRRDVPIKLQTVSNQPVEIQDDVFIGAHSTIIGPCTIGKGSVIGAGSVVKGIVKPYSIMAGVPAKRIGKR